MTQKDAILRYFVPFLMLFSPFSPPYSFLHLHFSSVSPADIPQQQSLRNFRTNQIITDLRTNKMRIQRESEQGPDPQHCFRVQVALWTIRDP